MAQDNPATYSPRTKSNRTETNRAESTRAERSRGEKAAASAPNRPFGGMANVAAGLRLQQQILEVLGESGREWLDWASSQAVLALKLPDKLTSVRSPADAVSAYQAWLTEWMSMAGEDTRRFVAGSRKVVDAGVRCFADAAPAVTSR